MKEAAKFTWTEICFLLISKYCLKNVEVSDNVQYRYIYHFNRFFGQNRCLPRQFHSFAKIMGINPVMRKYLNSFLLCSCPQHQWGQSFTFFLFLVLPLKLWSSWFKQGTGTFGKVALMFLSLKQLLWVSIHSYSFRSFFIFQWLHCRYSYGKY